MNMKKFLREVRLRRLSLSIKICSKCPELQREEHDYFGPGNSYFRKPFSRSFPTSGALVCGISKRTIGGWSEKGDEIWGCSVPLRCPFRLEYLMWKEKRKDERKGKDWLDKVRDTMRDKMA